LRALALAKIIDGVVVGIIALVAVLMALPTMWLWNRLMPEIFGLKTIGFWQALGLNLLCGILFKNGSIK
jgi:hypothetical protein